MAAAAMMRLGLGRSWFLKQNRLRDTCDGNHTCCPGPGLCGRGGRGPGRTLFQGEPPPCSGLALAPAPGSVLLLLFFRCGCREFVLNPEALHKEVDDGHLQVLVQGGSVEVMAFVGVDLRGRRGQVTRRWGGRPPPPNPARPGHRMRLGVGPSNGFPQPLQCWRQGTQGTGCLN